MSTAAQRLRALATERFPTLTPAEERLLGWVADGEEAYYESLNVTKNDPRQADTWGPERTIHAEVLRWLCVDRDAIRHVDPKGLSIHGARIDGTLDLSMVTMPFPLFLVRCALRESMNLEFAEVRLLGIIGSTTQAIHGSGMVVHGDLRLRDGFDARGMVMLFGATITNNLDCTGGRFHNAGGIALNAGGAKIDGTAVLGRGFKAEDEVNLVGATIGVNLDCAGGTFHNAGKTALNASTAKIGGTTFLSERFEAEGEVNLASATIGGSVQCDEGTFHNPDKIALNASGAKIDGSVWLYGRFEAEGEVNLAGAIIGGSLNCAGGTFHNAGKTALGASGAKIDGSVLLRGGFQAEGFVHFDGTHIQGYLDCYGASFSGDAPNGLLGEAMTVGRIFDWRPVTTNKETILSLAGAHVGELADNEDSWVGSEDPDSKHLDLDGFIYGGIFDGPTDATTRLRWLARQTPIPLGYAHGVQQPSSRPFRPQPYLQLAKVLRESGHEADAKRVLIEKERERRKHGDLSWVGRGWNWLLDVTIGYGYRPWLALIWAGFWVVVGGVLFGRGYDKEIVIPAKAEAYHSEQKTRQEPAFYPTFNRWLYALDTFVPIINFGQKEYWGPQVACNKSGLIRGGGIRLCVLGLLNKPAIRVLYLYRWLHIVVGWVLITLVVTGFTNLVRRE